MSEEDKLSYTSTCAPWALTFPFLKRLLIPNGFRHQLPIGVLFTSRKLGCVKVDRPI